jgi:gliding motility-associated lipoprotein GldD
MPKKVVSLVLFFIVFLLALSCRTEVRPKPTGQLLLEYPLAKYNITDLACNYNFYVNSDAIIKNKGNCNIEINYPKMKATIYLSYKPVQNNIENLLKDAQTLTYKHVIKADNILEQAFINRPFNVYGMFYDVEGNAATNAQFYVTDSIKNFIDCSLYFYAKPNFDSIVPAVFYLKKDMKMMMESVRWKNQLKITN